MHIKFNAIFLIAIFLVINAVLLGGIYVLLKNTVSIKTLNLDFTTKPSKIAFLDKDINALSVNSKAFIIYDPVSRTVIHGKNENLRFSPASSAKIMTATIALNEYHLDKIIAADGVNTVLGSSMDLVEGELITVESLLYGLMLPSGNDAAYVLAKDYFGGYDAFVQRMNKKAKELSLYNTYFVDPAGLEDENYSTAFDMARLAAYAMENEKFREIVSTRQTTVTDLSGNIIHPLTNLNELLALPEVVGIKTGFTEEAGGVLVTAVEKDDNIYIIVVLNSPDRFRDTREIMINAIRNIKVETF